MRGGAIPASRGCGGDGPLSVYGCGGGPGFYEQPAPWFDVAGILFQVFKFLFLFFVAYLELIVGF